MAQLAELEDRITKCNKILGENPNSQIFAALAEAYRKRGELDKAFRTCQTGLKIHPNYGSAHLIMAKINLDKGLYDWSEMEANKAIELDGRSSTTEFLLADIYLHRGEFVKAVKILNKLQVADPGNQQVRKLLDIAKTLPLESPDGSSTPAILKEEKDSGVVEAQSPKTEERIDIKQLLDRIADLVGVEGVLLINREGLVAESRWDEPRSLELYGAIAKDIESTVQSQIEIARFGKYENILLEADNLIVNLVPLKDNILLIKANKQINLGTLRLKLPALFGRISYDFS